MQRGHEVANRTGIVVGCASDFVRAEQPELVSGLAVDAVRAIDPVLAVQRREELINGGVGLVGQELPAVERADAIGALRSVGTVGTVGTVLTVFAIDAVLAAVAL